MALHTIEELANFPPARRTLCCSTAEQEQGRPNTHMAVLIDYVLRACTEAASTQQRGGSGDVALAALKALTALLVAWRLESASSGSLIAALQEERPALVPSLLQAAVAFLGSALLPYEVKNQAALVLVLAGLDSAANTDINDDDAAAPALAQALALCFLPGVEAPQPPSSSPLLAPLHPDLRGLPSALSLLFHAANTAPAIASEARLALARAVLVATDLPVLTAALPPALPLAYDGSVAAGGTLMGGTSAG